MRQNPNTSVPKSSYKSIGFTQRFAKLVAERGHRTATTSSPVSFDDVPMLVDKLRGMMDGIVDDDVVVRVLQHNPQIIRRVDRSESAEPAFLAYLPLNAAGFDALKQGRFDWRSPATSFLCKPRERIAALYIWCIYAPGNFIPAIAAIAAHFETIAPDGVPLFTRAANDAAGRLFRSLGFASARTRFEECNDSLLVVMPEAQSADETAKPVATTRITRTIEDLMKVFSIRAATYMNEQACPYDEEFDGNDFCAAHILGEIDGEPAGCIRVRFFGDFVKIERLAVRPEFRSSTLAFRLVRAAFDYCRSKGFARPMAMPGTTW